jgi:hypothetical protein
MRSNLTLCSILFTAAVASHTAFAQADKAISAGSISEVESGDAIERAKVSFIEPKDQATVGTTFKLKFAVQGLKVAEAGAIVPGSGHFHLLIDTPVIKRNEAIVADAKHIHYGKGQTEATLTLPPGKHQLTLQFADGLHRSYGPSLTQTITVNVK